MCYPRSTVLPLLAFSSNASAQIVGGQWETKWQFDGKATFDNLGASVSGAGDVNGDGFDDVIVGADWGSPGGLLDAGSAYVYSLDPFLHTDARTLSATSGVPVQLDLDFPAAEAGFSYAVLASGGTGPMTMGGLQIPLGEWNKLTQLMLRGWAPSNVRNWRGVLDSNGDATCTVLSDPRLARHFPCLASSQSTC